jgi:hypothetical protein
MGVVSGFTFQVIQEKKTEYQNGRFHLWFSILDLEFVSELGFGILLLQGLKKN